MADEEKSEDKTDVAKELKSIREVLSSTLEAMGRLKKSVDSKGVSSDIEKRLRALELSNEGLNERVDMLENAFREAFTKAQENLEAFINKAAEPDNEDTPPSEPGPDAEEPTAEVVG